MLKIYLDSIDVITVQEENIRLVALKGVNENVTWFRDGDKTIKGEYLSVNEVLISINGLTDKDYKLLKSSSIGSIELNGKDYVVPFEEAEDGSNKNEMIFLSCDCDVFIVIGDENFRNKMIEENKKEEIQCQQLDLFAPMGIR